MTDFVTACVTDFFFLVFLVVGKSFGVTYALPPHRAME